jgi:hypothetical protein
MQREDRLRKWRRRLAIVSALGLLAIVAIYIFRGIPRVAATAMRNADSFELLSLDPERGRDDADFHRFKVLGRTMVTDPATRKRLYSALQSGARWNLPFPAMCFNPRHGIRVTAGGRTVDLVICFECSQVQVWQGGSHLTTFIVGQSPESVFDQALRDTGLPLAPK